MLSMPRANFFYYPGTQNFLQMSLTPPYVTPHQKPGLSRAEERSNIHTQKIPKSEDWFDRTTTIKCRLRPSPATCPVMTSYHEIHTDSIGSQH
jgi:hypothetical protein